MPRLTFPTAPGGGLIVDVRVNLGSTAFALAIAAGTAKPAVPGRAVIDTGTNVTAVSQGLLRAIGAVPKGPASTTAVGGTVNVQMYEITLFVADAAKPHIPALAVDDLSVIDLPTVLDHDVLIGTDVLLKCRMFLDGPGGYFFLDY